MNHERELLSVKKQWRRVLLFFMVHGALCIALSGCDYFSPEPWEGHIYDPLQMVQTPVPPPALPTGRPFRDLFVLPWAPPRVVHPLTDASALNRSIYTLVYEGLFALDEHFEPQYQLAESILIDGTRVAITLRSGVTFHHGELLTARDAESSVRAAMRHDSVYAAQLSGIHSVRATSDHTLEIWLAVPNPRIAALLDIPIIPAGWSAAFGPPPGTGPFLFSGEETDPHLAAYPGWHRGTAIPFNRLELMAIADNRELTALFDSGNVNWINFRPTDTAAPWFHADSETWGYATKTLVFLGINTANAPLHWPDARAALSAAMDRGSWVHTVYEGHADPTLTVFPPASRFSVTACTGYDPIRFMELLTGLGVTDTHMTGLLDYPLGRTRQPFVLRLLTSSENPWRVRLAHTIAAHFRPLGIEIVVMERRWEDFQHALASGDYDIFIGELTLRADLDPTHLLSPGGAWVRCGYENEPMNELLSLWPGMAPDTLPALAAELNTLLAQEAPVVPLLFTRGLVRTTRGTVSGMRPVAGRPFDNITQWMVR
jgi:peptide/nickel transport system substrate-binding protein